jgi:hypothetical protein
LTGKLKCCCNKMEMKKMESNGIANFSISKGDDGMWIQIWR